MAKTSTTTVRVEILGDGAAPYNDSDVTTNTSAPAPTSQTATTTMTQVAIATGAIGVKIKPPPSNTIALTIGGASGDTGITIHPSNPSYLAFAAVAPGPLYVKCTSGTVALLFIWS